MDKIHTCACTWKTLVSITYEHQLGEWLICTLKTVVLFSGSSHFPKSKQEKVVYFWLGKLRIKFPWLTLRKTQIIDCVLNSTNDGKEWTYTLGKSRWEGCNTALPLLLFQFPDRVKTHCCLSLPSYRVHVNMCPVSPSQNLPSMISELELAGCHTTFC